MMTPEAWGAFLEGQDLLLQSGELQYPQRVVFQQETSEGVPAATDAHHHMFAMKHLRTKQKKGCCKNSLIFSLDSPTPTSPSVTADTQM